MSASGQTDQVQRAELLRVEQDLARAVGVLDLVDAWSEHRRDDQPSWLTVNKSPGETIPNREWGEEGHVVIPPLIRLGDGWRYHDVSELSAIRPSV